MASDIKAAPIKTANPVKADPRQSRSNNVIATPLRNFMRWELEMIDSNRVYVGWMLSTE